MALIRSANLRKSAISLFTQICSNILANLQHGDVNLGESQNLSTTYPMPKPQEQQSKHHNSCPPLRLAYCQCWLAQQLAWGQAHLHCRQEYPDSVGYQTLARDRSGSVRRLRGLGVGKIMFEELDFRLRGNIHLDSSTFSCNNASILVKTPRKPEIRCSYVMCKFALIRI